MRSPPPVDSLPGIDLPGFLVRFDGNFALLAGLLPRFVESCDKRIMLLDEHLQTGDLNEVAAMLHQLRGASANVGANDMANLATRAEETLAREGLEALRPLPGALTKAMLRVREAAAIVAALPSGTAAAGKDEDVQISRLLDLLQTNNMRALAVAEDCTGALTTALGKEQADAVISAVQALDFGDAYAKLVQLRPRGGG
jgi:HPt (histidine-containing phosphotransfer) domain-containing protein